ARKVRLIGESRKKDDRLDAQTLARLARIDPQLLYPVKHRSAQAQADLMMIRARAGLVRARTGLVNTAPGLAKSYGERLRGCNVRNMNAEKAEGLSPELQQALEPLLSAIEELRERICEYNDRIEALAEQSYPQVELLKQIKGVGTLIALTYLLTLEDPHRFGKSRDVITPTLRFSCCKCRHGCGIEERFTIDKIQAATHNSDSAFDVCRFEAAVETLINSQLNPLGSDAGEPLLD